LEVTYGALFERPTPLEDGERGLRNWLDLFGTSISAHLPAPLQDKLKQEIEREARHDLFQDGRWFMDYRRLRIVARKS